MPDASVDVSTIRDRFNFEWTMDPDNGAGADTYWWWARSIRVDPSELIADDGESGLWSVPFSTDGEDTVTFGEPVRVRETFVPVQAADGAAATALVSKRRQRVLATDLPRPTKQDPPNPAATVATEEEASSMTDEQRRSLAVLAGLDPDTATEEQIHEAAATAAASASSEEEQETTEVEQTETEVEREPEPVAASERVVTMDSGRVAQLEADAAAGRAAREQQIAADRDALVSAAVTDGRIAPASRQAWRSALDARPEAETAALAALTPGRIPVDERGVAASQDDNPNTSQGTGWFDHKFQEA